MLHSNRDSKEHDVQRALKLIPDRKIGLMSFPLLFFLIWFSAIKHRNSSCCGPFPRFAVKLNFIHNQSLIYKPSLLAVVQFLKCSRCYGLNWSALDSLTIGPQLTVKLQYQHRCALKSSRLDQTTINNTPSRVTTSSPRTFEPPLWRGSRLHRLYWLKKDASPQRNYA